MAKENREHTALLSDKRSSATRSSLHCVVVAEQRNEENHPEGSVSDSYPRQYARTLRFTCGEPRSVEITAGGLVFLRSRSSTDPINCLWRASFTEDGNLNPDQLLVDPVSLGSDIDDLPAAERARRERLREQASGITAYSLSADGSAAVFTLAGQVVLADLRSTDEPATVRVLETPPGSFDAQLSPDGSFVAYVNDGDLHVIHLAGTDIVLAHDDDPNILWGMADFNASEEFDRFRGFWWSPDSAQLVVARVDNNPVSSWFIADPAHPDRPSSEHRYPAAGTANAEVTLWLVGTDGTRTPILLSDVHPEYEYVLDVRWTSEGLVVVTLDREQLDQRVVLVAVDGTCTELHRVADDRWVELTPGTPRLAHDRMIHTSDILVGDEGDRVLVAVDASKSAIPMSPPHLLINRVVRIATDGSVLCCVTDRNVGSMYSSVVIISDVGTSTSLAGGLADLGMHTVMAADDHCIVIRSSSLEGQRAEHRVIHRGQQVGVLHSLADSPLVTPQPLFIRAGIRQIPVAVLLPSDPNLRRAGVKLPIIMDPYAGPHAARVIATRAALASSQWLADQGFAVVIVDGRGTPGIGPVYERALYRDLAGPVLADQVVGLLDAAAQVPQLDLTRVGIRGWSFGGYTAALAVLRRPDVFHCAVVGAPVIDWRLYDTGYTERYLGDPQFDHEAYERSSLINEAATLTRPIQLIHGLADDNVVAAHSLRFSSALVAAGIAHEMLPLSGVTHMTPQEEVAENLLLLQVDFLRRQLGGPIDE
jgi:dipeptidyl-peptidase 4